MNIITDGQRKLMFGIAKAAWESAGKPSDFNDWRHEQQQLCGIATLSDCTVENYQRLRVHFDWIIKNTVRHGQTQTERRTVRMDGHPCEAQLRKVYALLTDMSLSWEYADGMAARMYGQKRAEQLKPSELRGLISALMKRQMKHGGRREPARTKEPVNG
jgi:phage gp16-like protein